MSDDPPLARRMPGFEARHATRRARRTRAVAVVVVVVILAVFGVMFLHHGAKKHPTSARRPPAARLPRVISTLASWHLGAPISRAVVLPGSSGADQLVIGGGMTTGGLTASGVFALDLANGALTQVGDLTTTLDDATGALLDGQDVVFGGTSSASAPPSAVVQSLPAGTGAGPAVPTSTVLGTLPESRAAAAAVTVGSTTYLVGGETTGGSVLGVVSTTDGRHFTSVAALPVPVSFPAVAAAGNTLYVFGGVAIAGSRVGEAVSTIQVVNVRTHKVTDTGHLPVALTGAAAVVLGGDIFVVGGDASSTTSARTGPSTTAPSTTTPVTSAPSSTSTVWLFDPTSGACTPVGHLAVAVSHAGVAVVGSTAWLVGGESDGTPLSSVQSFVTTPGGSAGDATR